MRPTPHILTHAYTHYARDGMSIYIYIYICVCVCVYICNNSFQEKRFKKGDLKTRCHVY